VVLKFKLVGATRPTKWHHIR